MSDGPADINRRIYVTPSSQAVARLVASHGTEAALARWPWIGARTLGTILRDGRARLGLSVQSNGRTRSSSPEQEAAAIETAFVIGSRGQAERASGMGLNTLIGVFASRGIDGPVFAPATRGQLSAESKAAANGDVAAAGRMAARESHARAVYDVCLRALALVPDQPASGRYRLPPESPELADALAGCDPKAVGALFPGLAEAMPADDPTETNQLEDAMSQTLHRARTRMVPSDDEIRALLDGGTPTAADLASAWGVSLSSVYGHLRRLGLTLGRSVAAPQVPATVPVPVRETEATTPAPGSRYFVFEGPVPDDSIGVVPQPGQTRLLGRLDVDGLELAIQLARRTGLDPMDALTWVRADAAIAMREAPRAFRSEARV